MKTSARRALLIVCAAAVFASGAQAQTYPVKPVRFIVPAPPGSTPDFLARIVGQKLTEMWGQSVLVETVLGASGNIATDRVAKSAPDGYTLLFNTIGPIAINQNLFGKLPYDPVKDFAPITMVAITPNILCVHPSLPVKSLQQLITLIKSNPGKLHYGSAGSGTTPHLSGELLNMMAGVKAVHIPYRSSSQMVIDVIGGQVEFTIHNAPSVLPFVQSGKLRGLAITSEKRESYAPELPTMAEAGLPGFVVHAWFGVIAPAGTPPAIVARIHDDVVKVVAMNDVRERFMMQAAEPVGSRPEEYAAYIASEIVKWSKVVKESGATLD
jgi:tripartite-type tricarboxylate transporter receptor subunit TctC